MEEAQPQRQARPYTRMYIIFVLVWYRIRYAWFLDVYGPCFLADSCCKYLVGTLLILEKFQEPDSEDDDAMEGWKRKYFDCVSISKSVIELEIGLIPVRSASQEETDEARSPVALKKTAEKWQIAVERTEAKFASVRT